MIPQVSPPDVQPRTPAPGSGETAAFPRLCLLVAILFSAIPLMSSLWLDETATFWVVKDGIREVVSRSWQWSGQSALYYLTAWVFQPLARYLGLEVALRLPSLLFFLFGLGLLYSLGKYLMSPRAAMAGCLAFACMPAVSFSAIDARPYALGLALVVASMLTFLMWLDTGERRFAVLYILSTALVVYCHYLMGVALLAQLVYGIRQIRKLILPWSITAALCLPLASQLLRFYHTRGSHSIGDQTNITAFFVGVFTPVLAASMVAAAMTARGKRSEPNRIPWPFLLSWFLLPPGLLLAISLLTDTRLFLTRYYLSCAPAAALIAGYAISRLPGAIQKAVCAALTLWLGIAVWQSGWTHGGQNWRGAMAAVASRASESDVILIACNFVEGSGKNLNDPSLHDVLFAPQLAYPLKSFQRLPYSFDETAVPAGLSAAPHVFLVTSVSTLDSARATLRYQRFLETRLPGYRAGPIGNFGSVSAVEFAK